MEPESLTTVNGKPLEGPIPPSKKETTAEAVKQLDGMGIDATATKTGIEVNVSATHAAACGNVGLTGAHGDLGSNAKS